MELDFSRQIFQKNTQIEHFIKIRLVGAELFHTDRQKNYEANSRFSYSCERTYKPTS